MSSQIIWKQPWGRDAESVLRQALASQCCSVRELPSQQWDGSRATIAGIRDYKTSYLAPVSATWSSVMLHLNTWVGEPVAAELSRITDGLAILFLEYDQVAWGYTLFQGGKRLDCFWSVPDAVETRPKECAGSVPTIARLFGVTEQSIAPYIRHVKQDDWETKAFDGDEFALGNHWVRVDFMRKLGIPYPNPGRVAGGRFVQIEEAKRSQKGL